MEYADIPLFLQWVSRPHVAQWWESPPMEEIEAWFCHSTQDRRPTQEERPLQVGRPIQVGRPAQDGCRDVHYIAVHEELGPVGFIQAYCAVEGHKDGWWLDEHDPGVRGIDQFLADADQLGRGLGTALIRAFVAMQFEDPSVTRIQCDPAPHNRRAIRCYEKAGFRAVGEVVTPDGPALLMYCDRT